MATKRKAETGSPEKAVVTKKLALDAKQLKNSNKTLVTPKTESAVESRVADKVGELPTTPKTPLKDKRLSGILKAVGVTSPRSPNRVTFPPPSNMRETLSSLDDNAVANLVHQLESLQGASLVLWLEELTSCVSLLDRRPERGQSVESLVAELLKIKFKNPYVWDVVEPHTPPNIQLGLCSPRRNILQESSRRNQFRKIVT